MDRNIRMWTIYRSPKDYPGQFVAREWLVTDRGQTLASKEPLSIHEQLRIVRMAIQYQSPGAMLVPRSPGDDPVILETWM
jgi:hypothetical protein